jgi:DNA-binding GntR family transcriptional regulator
MLSGTGLGSRMVVRRVPVPDGASAFEVAPLERASTAEQVAAVIRQQLLDGEVAPGTKLSDQVTAAALGVSRNTAREAMLILAAEGLLTRNLHKGVVVAELDLDELADVYQARRALELAALEFAARDGNEWLIDLRAALTAMHAAAVADETSALLDADRAFHEVIVRRIGSERISRFYRLIQTEIRLTRAWHRPRMPAATFVERHAEIVEALEAQDLGRGRDLLERLIDDGQARLQQELRRTGDA